jgi:hypothetical protein
MTLTYLELVVSQLDSPRYRRTSSAKLLTVAKVLQDLYKGHKINKGGIFAESYPKQYKGMRACQKVQ